MAQSQLQSAPLFLLPMELSFSIFIIHASSLAQNGSRQKVAYGLQSAISLGSSSADEAPESSSMGSVQQVSRLCPVHLGLSPHWVLSCLPVPKLKGCQIRLRSTSKLTIPVLPQLSVFPPLRGKGSEITFKPRLTGVGPRPPSHASPGACLSGPPPWQRSALLWPPGIRSISAELLM